MEQLNNAAIQVNREEMIKEVVDMMNTFESADFTSVQRNLLISMRVQKAALELRSANKMISESANDITNLIRGLPITTETKFSIGVGIPRPPPGTLVGVPVQQQAPQQQPRPAPIAVPRPAVPQAVRVLAAPPGVRAAAIAANTAIAALAAKESPAKSDLPPNKRLKVVTDTSQVEKK
jgi:hypothetical protein